MNKPHPEDCQCLFCKAQREAEEKALQEAIKKAQWPPATPAPAQSATGTGVGA